MLLKTPVYMNRVTSRMLLQKVFPTFCASLPSSVKHEMFGNRFELRFSGDALRPQHMTVCMHCQDIVCVDVTYKRRPMSHEMRRRQQQQQQRWRGGSGRSSSSVQYKEQVGYMLSFGHQLSGNAWDLGCWRRPARERGPSTMLSFQAFPLEPKTLEIDFSNRPN